MQIDKAIIWAREEGLSVIEITRAVLWKAGDVHDLLRNKGMIDPIRKRSEKPKPVVLDGKILIKLRKKSLSFERWAIGWGFEAAEAEAPLSVEVNTGDSDSEMIHQGLCRDFPREYSDVYGKMIVAPIRLPQRVDEKHSFTLSWDTEKNRYLGKVVGYEEVEGCGFTPKEALDTLLKNLGEAKMVNRLKLAVAQYKANIESVS